MKQKKTLSIAAGIMLIAVALAVVPSAEAAYPHSIKGVLYTFDGQNTAIAPTGINIEIEFKDGPESTTTYEYNIYEDSTNYNLRFFGHDSPYVQPGYFTVFYQGHELTPIDNESKIITEEQEGYIVDLTIDISNLNSPPNAPTLVSPSDGVGGVGLNPALTVSVSDPEGDPMTVTFYDASDDSVIGTKTEVASGSKTSVTWSNRAYSTTYSWYATAADTFGTSPQSETWSFTTQDEPEEPPSPPPSPPGGGGTGGGTPTNLAPNANAGGPYTGVEGEEVSFNGSKSTDDGTIVSYNWNFGDGNTGSGVTTTHIYSTAGTYTVTLIATDNGGKTGSSTTTATIAQFNNPPTTPMVSGPKKGNKNTNYEYIAVSTDADDDTIQYMFDWDDGTNTTTAFVDNATEVTENHSWSSYGFYIVTVKATDDLGGESGTRQYVVAIDVIWVKQIGYLIDSDSDGTYDSFYSNETGAQSAPEKQDDGTYNLNSDRDADWEWNYDPETDTLTALGAPSKAEEDYTWLYALILVIILLLIIGGAAAGRKKKSKKKSDKPKNKK